MSEIRIKPAYVRDTNTTLSQSYQNLSNIESGVSSLRYSIDSKITSRRSIGTRLNRAKTDIDQLQSQVRELETFIQHSVTRYANTENKLCRDVKDIGDESGLDATAIRNTLIGLGAGLLNSSKLLRLKNGLQFKLFKQNKNFYIKIMGDKIRSLADYQKYRQLLKEGLGGSAKWKRDWVTKLVNEGVPLYEKQSRKSGQFYGSNSNKLINTQFGDLGTYINQLSTDRYKIAGQTFVDELKVWESFKGWKGATNLTKLGKGAGVLGIGIDVYSNFMDNFKNPAGEWDWSGENIKEFVVDTTVDVGIGTGAMAAGAAAGSFFLPPVGTVVGAAVGSVIYAGFNWKYGDPPMSFIDRRKEDMNKAVDWVGEQAGKLANAAGDFVGGIGKKLSNVFW
ncbi:hypothetical protein [Fredinandcohnia sp. 179-A 10B2 NHS]|uniref:hypothetical protein n=1 Tax=Fredinandcohnia sp. 179-A 10B2 NHS TaxID=3235176 RepID=UPI0039A1BC58